MALEIPFLMLLRVTEVLFSLGAEDDGIWWVWGSIITKTGSAAGVFRCQIWEEGKRLEGLEHLAAKSLGVGYW